MIRIPRMWMVLLLLQLLNWSSVIECKPSSASYEKDPLEGFLMGPAHAAEKRMSPPSSPWSRICCVELENNDFDSFFRCISLVGFLPLCSSPPSVCRYKGRFFKEGEIINPTSCLKLGCAGGFWKLIDSSLGQSVQDSNCSVCETSPGRMLHPFRGDALRLQGHCNYNMVRGCSTSSSSSSWHYDSSVVSARFYDCDVEILNQNFCKHEVDIRQSEDLMISLRLGGVVTVNGERVELPYITSRESLLIWEQDDCIKVLTTDALLVSYSENLFRPMLSIVAPSAGSARKCHGICGSPDVDDLSCESQRLMHMDDKTRLLKLFQGLDQTPMDYTTRPFERTQTQLDEETRLLDLFWAPEQMLMDHRRRPLGRTQLQNDDYSTPLTRHSEQTPLEYLTRPLDLFEGLEQVLMEYGIRPFKPSKSPEHTTMDYGITPFMFFQDLKHVLMNYGNRLLELLQGLEQSPTYYPTRPFDLYKGQVRKLTDYVKRPPSLLQYSNTDALNMQEVDICDEIMMQEYARLCQRITEMKSLLHDCEPVAHELRRCINYLCRCCAVDRRKKCLREAEDMIKCKPRYITHGPLTTSDATTAAANFADFLKPILEKHNCFLWVWSDTIYSIGTALTSALGDITPSILVALQDACPLAEEFLEGITPSLMKVSTQISPIIRDFLRVLSIPIKNLISQVGNALTKDRCLLSPGCTNLLQGLETTLGYVVRALKPTVLPSLGKLVRHGSAIISSLQWQFGKILQGVAELLEQSAIPSYANPLKDLFKDQFKITKIIVEGLAYQFEEESKAANIHFSDSIETCPDECPLMSTNCQSSQSTAMDENDVLILVHCSPGDESSYGCVPPSTDKDLGGSEGSGSESSASENSTSENSTSENSEDSPSGNLEGSLSGNLSDHSVEIFGDMVDALVIQFKEKNESNSGLHNGLLLLLDNPEFTPINLQDLNSTEDAEHGNKFELSLDDPEELSPPTEVMEPPESIAKPENVLTHLATHLGIQVPSYDVMQKRHSSVLSNQGLKTDHLQPILQSSPFKLHRQLHSANKRSRSGRQLASLPEPPSIPLASEEKYNNHTVSNEFEGYIANHHNTTDNSSYEDSNDTLSLNESTDSLSYKEINETLSYKQTNESLTYKETNDSLSYRENSYSLGYNKTKERLSYVKTKDSLIYKESKNSLIYKETNGSLSSSHHASMISRNFDKEPGSKLNKDHFGRNPNNDVHAHEAVLPLSQTEQKFGIKTDNVNIDNITLYQNLQRFRMTAEVTGENTRINNLNQETMPNRETDKEGLNENDNMDAFADGNYLQILETKFTGFSKFSTNVDEDLTRYENKTQNVNKQNSTQGILTVNDITEAVPMRETQDSYFETLPYDNVTYLYVDLSNINGFFTGNESKIQTVDEQNSTQNSLTVNSVTEAVPVKDAEDVGAMLSDYISYYEPFHYINETYIYDNLSNTDSIFTGNETKPLTVNEQNSTQSGITVSSVTEAVVMEQTQENADTTELNDSYFENETYFYGDLSNTESIFAAYENKIRNASEHNPTRGTDTDSDATEAVTTGVTEEVDVTILLDNYSALGVSLFREETTEGQEGTEEITSDNNELSYKENIVTESQSMAGIHEYTSQDMTSVDEEYTSQDMAGTNEYTSQDMTGMNEKYISEDMAGKNEYTSQDMASVNEKYTSQDMSGINGYTSQYMAGMNENTSQDMDGINEEYTSQDMDGINGYTSKDMAGVSEEYTSQDMSGINENTSQDMAGINEEYTSQDMAGMNENISQDMAGIYEYTSQDMAGINEYTSQDMAGINEYISQDMANVEEYTSQDMAGINEYTSQDMSGINKYTSQDMANVDEEYTSQNMAGINEYTSQDMAGINEEHTSQDMAGINENTSQDMAVINEYTSQEMAGINEYTSQDMAGINEYTSQDMAGINEYTSQDMAGINKYTSQDMANVDEKYTSQDMAGIDKYTSQDMAGINGNTSLDMAGINEYTSQDMANVDEEYTSKYMAGINEYTSQDMVGINEYIPSSTESELYASDVDGEKLSTISVDKANIEEDTQSPTQSVNTGNKVNGESVISEEETLPETVENPLMLEAELSEIFENIKDTLNDVSLNPHQKSTIEEHFKKIMENLQQTYNPPNDEA